MHTIQLQNKTVGAGEPIFVIAEAGVNHNGDIQIAKDLIDAAVEAGADAVKFQTFDPRTLVTKTADKAEYQTENIGDESHYDMLDRLKLPREHHQELIDYATSKGILFLSTPFSQSDADFLLSLSIPAFKVGASDANNIPFLETIAQNNIPIFLSTGMCTLEEVRESVDAIRKYGNEDIVVLQCTTNYPTAYDEANIKAMLAMRDELGVLAGFSDHTVGIEVSIAAAALGAVLIEKHYTLDRNLPGPDHKASLEPHELKDMVTSIRNVEKALGNGEKIPFDSELKVAEIARKSLIAARAIPKGKKIEMDDIVIMRPGTGMPPKDLKTTIGKTIHQDVEEETVLTPNMFT